jgi:hypothetical protein
MISSWIQSIITTIINTIQNKTNTTALPTKSLVEKIKDYYVEHGYPWDEINLIGIRCTDIPYRNQFKDLFLLVDNTTINKFLITTLPGTTWTPELRKKYGVKYEATICFGFYPNVYGIGLHRGYEALTQQGGPVTCFIDANKDGLQQSNEKVIIEKVGSGMNIHKSGVDNQAYVGLSSAGCQVFPHHSDFYWVIDRVKQTQKYKKNKKALFSYLLVNSQEFPLIEEIRSI